MTNFTAKFNATVDEISKAFLSGKIDKATAEKRFAETLKLKEAEEAAKVKAEEQKAREIKLTKVAKEAAYALADYIIVLVEDIAPIDPKDRAEMVNLIFEALMEFKNIDGAKGLKEAFNKMDKESAENEVDLDSLASLAEIIREFEEMGDPSKLSDDEIEKKLNKVFGGKPTRVVATPQKIEVGKRNGKIRDNEKIFENFFKNL